MIKRTRMAVGGLALSAAAIGAWIGHEGTTLAPVIPTVGDVPTIASGITRYEDGTPVRMTDPPITRQRAEQLTRNVLSADERRFRASLAGVDLYQEEYDFYFDFFGQFGSGNWQSSPMRRHLIAGEYTQACEALLEYRYMTGPAPQLGWEAFRWDSQGKPTRWRYDCSTVIDGRRNRQCWGVWTRQQERHEKCLAAQDPAPGPELAGDDAKGGS